VSKQRAMAKIVKIDSIRPIPDADSIECARVGGWNVVIKRGDFAVGDIAIYCEIDSWIPHELAPFLSKGSQPRLYNDVRGERLRTVKLRGQISQGLLLKVAGCFGDTVTVSAENATLFREGDDVTEALNIQKWEAPVPAQLAGQVRGLFPNFIPKTDQERCQNLVEQISAAQGRRFEVTEKLDGSSMTCYLFNDEFGVCSRNLDLKQDSLNSFWRVAVEKNIEQRLRQLGSNLAIQGELVGPGIQNNLYKLSQLEFFVFDVYDISAAEYLSAHRRQQLVKQLELNHVPVIDNDFQLDHNVDQLLALAEQTSQLNARSEREGVVFKEIAGKMTFKAISNRFLMKTHG
jgi:RNA ligase (TIGR02306 family)